MSNAEIPLFVAAAYDALITEQLEAGERWRAMFPLTPERVERNRMLRVEEEERIVTLMKDHQTVAGTTSICRCGVVGYSTSGYLLHLYTVVEADHAARTGCEDR